MKRKKKVVIRSLIISIFLAVIAVVVTLSSTNALFVNKTTQNRLNNYNTGILSITALSKTDTISLENTLPMPDADGELLDPYIFTIKNNGNVDYKFSVQLLATGENTFDSHYIKVKVDDEEVTTLYALDSTIKTDITLGAGESMDITLRVWLSSDTPNNQIGKTFNSQLVINGMAVSTSTNYGTTAAAYITNLYNNNEDSNHVSHDKEVVTNNEIDYNYATYASLMNDRLGGATKDLNAGNIRYYGATPSNYIYFNCSDYNNQSDETCEKWRIIGVFDNMVKIVRNESIGAYSWDTSADSVNTGYGINEWSQADLMKLLNPGYDNNKLDGDDTIKVNNSLYWNHGSGNCYYGRYNSYKQCNFSSNGLKNDETRNRIATATWNLGGLVNSNYKVEQFYLQERSTSHVSNPDDGISRSDTWTGKIALIYPSDYGYATDLYLCNNLNLSGYGISSCTENDWLYFNLNQRTLTSATDGSAYIFYVYSEVETNPGKLTRDSSCMSNIEIRPTLFLNSEVSIIGGDGSEQSPYKIK